MALSKIQDIGNQVVPNLGRRNLIINGGMRIAQRSTSAVASGNPGIHTIDRFHVWNGTDGAWTSERSTDAPEGFSNSFKAQVTSADTSLAAGQYAQFEQKIEAQSLQHLNYGSSTAKTLTLSFHCKSNKTGTYGVCVYKEDGTGGLSTMLFPVDFSISSADTWEKKTITIGTDSTIRGAAGVINDDNGAGLRIFWNLAQGSQWQVGTNSTWSTNTNHFATSNQTTNWMDSTSNNFYITGVQLEVGDTATDFEHRSFAEEFSLCQRYYQTTGGSGFTQPYANHCVVINYSTGTDQRGVIPFTTEMRAKPSMTQVGNMTVLGLGGGLSSTNVGDGCTTHQAGIRVNTASNISTGQGALLRNNNDATAHLAFDAELN